jgi:hypothetical protein
MPEQATILMKAWDPNRGPSGAQVVVRVPCIILDTDMTPTGAGVEVAREVIELDFMDELEEEARKRRDELFLLASQTRKQRYERLGWQ